MFTRALVLGEGQKMGSAEENENSEVWLQDVRNKRLKGRFGDTQASGLQREKVD